MARRGPSAEALRPYEFGPDNFAGLQLLADTFGITFLCSVFDQQSAAEYLALDPPAVKIGSGELTDVSLIRGVAYASSWPIILSTGMSTMREVSKAILEIPGRDRVALLHCVSAYPTPLEQVNLRAMDALKAFHCPVGWSDHTVSPYAVIAAVARGAVIIEKHLTLDRTLPGPDHYASTEPRHFKMLVEEIRLITGILGSGEKRVMPCEAATMKAIGR